MATLQKLRNAGPLLVIFVGVALLAFVAGDALRIFQSPQGSQSVGSINGKEITAVEYQDVYEKYANAYKIMSNNAPQTEEQVNNLKDQVWSSYVYYNIIKEEADKIGLTVTDKEIVDIATKGIHPIFRQFPVFFDRQQNKFDVDALNQFLVEYDNNKENPQYIQQAQPLYELWKFIENELRQSALVEKYNALVSASFISNPVVAQNVYDVNNVTYDIELKAYPYSAIADSTITVSDDDIKKVYEEQKEFYKNNDETRSIKYVSQHITPAQKDRDALREEMTAYADTLRAGNTEYATIARLSNSEFPYSSIAWAKDIYPEEVQLRLDSLKENEVSTTIYNQSDDSYTVIKFMGKKTVPDSILCRILPVGKEIADSLLIELKNGADFKAMSQKYNNAVNDSIWYTSAMYEGMPLAGDDEVFTNALINGKKGEYACFELTNNKVIYQVIDTKCPETKYNALVIKRTSQFSKETYDEAYNKFSQFVASCKTVEDLEKNAEEYGYNVVPTGRIMNSSHNIANIADTRDAIRWLFNEAKLNEVSPLYECGQNDNLLVLALTEVNEKGYIPLESRKFLFERKAKNNEKAEKIIEQIKGKNFDELASVANIKSDNVKRISFDAPARINITSANEPAINAAVTRLQVNEVSEPIKGNNAVYVIKLIAKNNKPGEFNATSQQETLKAEALRVAGNYYRDLYEKANVTDNRYLYF